MTVLRMNKAIYFHSCRHWGSDYLQLHISPLERYLEPVRAHNQAILASIRIPKPLLFFLLIYLYIFAIQTVEITWMEIPTFIKVVH